MSTNTSRLIFLMVLLLADAGLYYFLSKKLRLLTKRSFLLYGTLYWLAAIYVIVCFAFIQAVFLNIESSTVRLSIIGSIAFFSLVKVLLTIYLTLDGTSHWLAQKLSSHKNEKPTVPGYPLINRQKFLYKAAIMTASVPVAAFSFNIINRAYDYQVRRIRVVLPHLPANFHGLTIGHISDIHSGSFDNKTAVKGGVDLLMNQKADVVFFTGDLVNVEAKEAREYLPIFSKVKAPLGVYSVLGNHDYGDYRSWPSSQAKQKNLVDVKTAHKELGWDLLCNESRTLPTGQDPLEIIGVENWGIRRFSKYGNLAEAHRKSKEAPVKLLLSHDPSHWEAQVLDYPDIDLTFSGHTHGFQFGVEFGNIAWSPAQYLYKQWAGLYEKNNQYLYVNRGYGFIGMPGRIGISPEITLIELVKG